MLRDEPWSPAALNSLSAMERELFRKYGMGPRQVVAHAVIHDAIAAHVAATPHVPAAEHLGETVSYAELDARAAALASRLAEGGVRPGDHVGLFVRRGIPMVVGILATLKAGAAYVPQDVGVAPESQLRHVVRAAGCRAVLTTSEHAALVPDGILIDAPLAPAQFAPSRPATPADHCYVLFTSGTTGVPNGVAVTHANVANLLLTSPGDLGIRPGWRVAQLLNIAFDMAAWEILGCLAHGGTLLIRGGDLAATALRADVLIATPTILGRLDPDECRSVRVVAVAGEPCPRPLADRWAAFAGFWNGCGPTEVTIVNTMQRHDPAAVRLTIGRPTPNNTVYVLGEDGRPCPIGETGEMWAGGDCVSAGYLGNPELTAERYRPDPFLGGDRMMFRTRDLGRWTVDGELEHLGRTDDQVKIRGFRVELDAVSAVLESLPGCARAATVKVDGETLVSFVDGAVDAERARAAVAAALPYYCVPAAVHVVDTLPTTARGKIDKGALLALAVTYRAGLAA